MSVQTSGISAINLVMIPSPDQDRSISFYVDVLGFEKRTDVPFGGSYRWVEVYPPSGSTGIALAPPRETDPVGIQTGISLTTTDIEATHAALTAAGVDADDVMRMGGPVPPMFFFRDPDANTLLVVQEA